MDESAISVRYARALFLLAQEKNLLSELKYDMELLTDVCNMSADFNLMLKSPVIKTSEKIRLMKLIFGEKTGELTMNFLELVTRNNREVFIPSMCRNILSLIREEKNIKTAVLTIARPVDNETLRNAEEVLEKELGYTIELKGKINPKIIGGMILRIGDKQYDASVMTRLKALKQAMLKPIIK
jgi:F-type H+-transporting ATPase subunit delta